MLLTAIDMKELLSSDQLSSTEVIACSEKAQNPDLFSVKLLRIFQEETEKPDASKACRMRMRPPLDVMNPDIICPPFELNIMASFGELLNRTVRM